MRVLDALRRELRLDDSDVDEILRAALGPAGGLPFSVRDLSNEIVEVTLRGFTEVSRCHSRVRGDCDGRTAAYVTWRAALGLALRVIATVARMRHLDCVSECILARCGSWEDGACAEMCDAMCARSTAT
jgi:hypothetical protein